MIFALRTITTLFFVFNFFSIQAQVSDPSPATPPAVPKPSGEIFTIQVQEPKFPGGNDSMKKFIADRIDTEKIEVEGKVILQFIVQIDGSITNIKVVRGLSPAEDSQAVRIVRAMPKWSPFKVRGKVDASRFTLEMLFKRAQQNAAVGSEKLPIAVTPASFPRGEQALKSFIDSNRNINNIMEIEDSEGITPSAEVAFIVNTDGSITNIQCWRSTNNDYRKEALRIVGLMPNWTPEQVGGKARAKQVQLKIEFPNN